MNILKIDSSGRTSGSVSRSLTEKIATKLCAAFPEAGVHQRDLSSGFSSVSEAWIAANFTPPESRTQSQKEVLQQSDELVAELASADVLVIGLPIYNFGLPASLKAWIDLICRAGETFRYTEEGPEGLLKNKRAVIAVASGGVPIGSPVDFATSHLTHVLNFIGITDVTYVGATGLALDPETPLQSAEAEIDQMNFAKVA